MNLRLAPLGALRLAGPALLALITAGCNREPQAPPLDIKALMANHVQPTAEVYWNAVQYISDETGSRKIEPRTDAEWTRTQEAAAKLRQLGEQMKDPAVAAGRGTDWQDFAQGLADVATQAEQAAKQRSPDKVFEVGGAIYNVCSACHEVYMPSPGGAAPAGVASAAATTGS
ncbi:hypothetical protein GGQ88_000614 [Novosphingobium hassiacum]|uniref:Cytochrome c n=1 Tax=Novosphingobium hassiacum TaxID=173676 RepID=A0A7W5ZU90_9SPHN|nr:hypothetical protein [Novosphingobium hassiacum]MBB3859374.1 hypothetical protein [Novosphingobium hassiacum]